MNTAESTIIRAFEEQKSSLTADDIMPLLFYSEYNRLNQIINDEFISEEKKVVAQESLNQLRRRVLYHLKILENKKIIRLTKRGAKGKKHYVMEAEKTSNEYTIENNTKIISENDHVDSYIIRENSEHWAKKFSSLLIECENNNEKDILKILGYSKSIGDAISLNNPNNRLLTQEVQEMIKRTIAQEQITFSSIVEVNNTNKEVQSEKEFQKLIHKIISTGITIILSIESNDLKKLELIKKIEDTIKQCIDARVPLYIHNKDAKKAPVFIGMLGPYTLSEKEYNKLNERIKDEKKAFIVGLNNVLCDVESFLKDKTVTDLRRALLLKGTDLFVASLNLRRRAPELLPESIFGKHVLDLGRDYYRFWNYGLKDPETDQETVITLLKSAKEIIASYAHAQSTIYTSCGMPTPFKTAFSVLFEEGLPKIFSEGQFKKLIVKDIRDLMEKEVKQTLFLKQEASEIFNGGDRTRITKKNGNTASEILNEISFVQKSYSIPLVCYDFSSHEKELTLKEFF